MSSGPDIARLTRQLRELGQPLRGYRGPLIEREAAAEAIEHLDELRRDLVALTKSSAMSGELDDEWTTGLDYGWPQTLTFVIDVELRDQAALDMARNHVGTTARVLDMINGVQLSDMGVGLAIREDRDQLLAVFDQSVSTSLDAPENSSEPSA